MIILTAHMKWNKRRHDTVKEKNLIPNNEIFTSNSNSLTKDRKTKILTTTSLFIALNLVLNQITVPIGPTIEIGFAFLPIAVLAYLYGPFNAGISAAIADVLGFLLRPSGFFFPGFTLNALLMGIIFGIFLHRKKITLQRIAFTVLLETIIVSIVLTPIWLNIMYETPLVTIPRIIKSAILYPINVGLLYIVLVNYVKRGKNERN